jgi:hypothetical protein
VDGRKGLVADGRPDGHFAAAVCPQGRRRVLGRGADDEVSAEFLSQLHSLVGHVDG